MLVALAHRLLMSLPRELTATLGSPKRSPRSGERSPRFAERSRDRSDILSEYDIPVAAIARADDMGMMLRRTTQRFDQFLERGPDGRFRPVPGCKLKQSDMEIMLRDVELLDVFVSAWRQHATTRLDKQVADNLLLLMEFFNNMCVAINFSEYQ